MNQNDFINWLKGFLAAAPKELDADKVALIAKQLDEVKAAAIALPPVKPVIFGDTKEANPFVNPPFTVRYDDKVPTTLTNKL